MNIVITGTSSGIGFELVKSFYKESNNNIIAISRNRHKLEKLLNECKNINSSSSLYILDKDITNFNIDWLNEIGKHLNSIDILVNNAGLLINKNFENITLQDAYNIFNTNFFSVVNLIKVLLPLLKNSNKSHVLNIGSMGGFQGSVKFNGLSLYSSSKAALSCLTECLANEFEGKIIFNCLALGSVQTEMLNNAFPKYKAPVKPDEIAEFIKYFSIECKKFFNGKVIPVSITTP